MKRWQPIWWGFTFDGRLCPERFWRLCLRGWRRKYPTDGPHRGCIYSAMYRFGPLEVRRWAPVSATEAADREAEQEQAAVGAAT